MTKKEALVNIEMTAKDMIFLEKRIGNERCEMFDDEEADFIIDKFIEGYQEKNTVYSRIRIIAIKGRETLFLFMITPSQKIHSV